MGRYSSGTNRALWGHINGSPGADWGKVHAILKHRDESNQSSCGGHGGGSFPVSSFPVYHSRKEFKEGAGGKCIHCRELISVHTPKKKWCPKKY